MQMKLIVAVLLITLVGAMDLRAYSYSQSDRMRIEEADRRGGDEGRRVREKIQQEHLDTWVFLNKMRKKNAIFYVTEDGTLDVMRERPRAHPQDPYAGMTALERDAAKRRAESAARSRDYQRRMAEEAARVSYAISAKGKLDRSVARLRETLEKMERDKVRRAQREIKRLKKMSRQLGIELDLKE